MSAGNYVRFDRDVVFLSVFGMVEVDIYIMGTLITSFFWLDFIYYNFWFFILVYAIMLALSMTLERKSKMNVYIGTLETDGTKLWQVRILFILFISVFLVLIILDLMGVFRINVSFSFMVIAPNTLAEQVVRQMYNLIFMAFCAFGIAIVVVR